MSTQPSNQKAFTSSELVLLQKIYRSRDFKRKITGQQTENVNRFLLYGSINSLSSPQRTAFRQHVSKISSLLPLINVKRALFSSALSKTITGYSSLTSLQNAFKGTTYELEITFSNCEKEPIYVIRTSCINYLAKLQFSEDSTFNFSPSLVLFVSNTGQLSPRRYDQQQVLTVAVDQKSKIRQQLVNQIESTYNQII